MDIAIRGKHSHPLQRSLKPTHGANGSLTNEKCAHCTVQINTTIPPLHPSRISRNRSRPFTVAICVNPSCLIWTQQHLVHTSCRHYFAVMAKLLDKRSDTSVVSQHPFDSACVPNRWREPTDGRDAPRSVNQVLQSSGHDEGRAGNRDGGSDGGWGPTLDVIILTVYIPHSQPYRNERPWWKPSNGASSTR